MTDPRFANIGSPITRLIEECAELQQALCKAERFGWFSHHPDRPLRTNMDDVKAEMSDVVECIEKVEVLMREMKFMHYRTDRDSSAAMKDGA
jgi:hypothetical protein